MSRPSRLLSEAFASDGADIQVAAMRRAADIEVLFYSASTRRPPIRA